MNQEFKQSILNALADPNLCRGAGKLFRGLSRRAAPRPMKALTSKLCAARSPRSSPPPLRTSTNWPSSLRSAAEARGTKVFRANVPQAVRDYILRLAQERGVKRIVKSKSMATEEIHLNQHLEKAGIDVRRPTSASGSFSLAGQTPSHMVMPAIHMTKEEVAEVFSDKVEEGQKPDIPQAGEVCARQAAPDVSQGRHGHHRRQHRRGRNRQHRHRDQ